MKKNERERVLDLEKIRKLKQKMRRRKILLAVGAALFLAAVLLALGIWQISQVTNSDRDFWGNFNPSYHNQQENNTDLVPETKPS